MVFAARECAFNGCAPCGVADRGAAARAANAAGGGTTDDAGAAERLGVMGTRPALVANDAAAGAGECVCTGAGDPDGGLVEDEGTAEGGIRCGDIGGAV